MNQLDIDFSNRMALLALFATDGRAYTHGHYSTRGNSYVYQHRRILAY